MGVQAIIVIEDNVRFYSSYLPMIYTEVMHHAQTLLARGSETSPTSSCGSRPGRRSSSARRSRRPGGTSARIATTCWGVISDIEFPMEGELRPARGPSSPGACASSFPDSRLLLQSSVPQNEALARSVGASFLLKNSPTLLGQLRPVHGGALQHRGLRCSVLPDGTEVAKATDLKALEEKLATVAGREASPYHGERNHFSKLAEGPAPSSRWPTGCAPQGLGFRHAEDLRRDMIRSIQGTGTSANRGNVTDFDPATFDVKESFSRIGGGSLGRGRRAGCLREPPAPRVRRAEPVPRIRIAVPPSGGAGDDVFDRFVGRTGSAISRSTPRTTPRSSSFRAAPFPDENRGQRLVSRAGPLPARGALLEPPRGLPVQPVAGIYETYMLPNTTRTSRSGSRTSSTRCGAWYAPPSANTPRPTSRTTRTGSRRRDGGHPPARRGDGARLALLPRTSRAWRAPTTSTPPAQ